MRKIEGPISVDYAAWCISNVFRRYPVQIFSRLLTILEVFHGFPQFLETNTWDIPSRGHDHLLSYPYLLTLQLLFSHFIQYHITFASETLQLSNLRNSQLSLNICHSKWMKDKCKMFEPFLSSEHFFPDFSGQLNSKNQFPCFQNHRCFICMEK